MSDNNVDLQEFKRALSCFATGVAIATTLDSDGNKVGMTISSFNSVSLDPPLVLWSIANDANSYSAFTDAKYFAVNVLAMHQDHIASQFAQKGEDKFQGLECRRGIHGVPLLPEYAACFECSTENIFDGGDHKIIVGRVLRLDDKESDPLIFYRGRFLKKAGAGPSET